MGALERVCLLGSKETNTTMSRLFERASCKSIASANSRLGLRISSFLSTEACAFVSPAGLAGEIVLHNRPNSSTDSMRCASGSPRRMRFLRLSTS